VPSGGSGEINFAVGEQGSRLESARKFHHRGTFPTSGEALGKDSGSRLKESTSTGILSRGDDQESELLEKRGPSKSLRKVGGRGGRRKTIISSRRGRKGS